jgi:hypothetical protein
MFRAAVMAWVVSLVTACGGGGGGSVPVAPVVNNQLGIYVDSGPQNTGYNVNRLYTDVTICNPGASAADNPTQCQTINHVLVDTGSTGLRILASVMAPALNLSRQTAIGGFPLLTCAPFADTSCAWGSVAIADVVLAGMTAKNVPIQIMGDPTYNSLGSACSVGGTALTTAAIIGSNGIIGLDFFKEDCGSGCTTVTNNGFYYTCTNAGCTSVSNTRASIAQQVKNPVPLFATDNNGILINLPAASLSGAPSLSGSLIFGIGTQSNNQLASNTVLTTSSDGNVTTRLASKTLATSFIDSGSNGLYFDSSSIPRCPGSNVPGFYCPSSPLNFSATLEGANAQTLNVDFTIDNALGLFSTGVNHVLPTLAGNMGDATTFDWGLPFFYGRRVFIGIEGMTPAVAPGSFYAF